MLRNIKKSIVTLFTLGAISTTSHAALIHEFDFSNGLNNTAGSASLTGSGSITNGRYNLEALPSNFTTLGIYGLQLDAGFSAFTSNDYRIEFAMEFDGSLSNTATFGGWKKLLDFSSLTQDEGVYMRGANEMIVYNPGSADLYSNIGFDLSDSMEYLFAFTRDAITKEFSMFLNDQLIGSFIDSDDVGVTNGNALTFFTDDRGGWETFVNASVDNIRIFDSLDGTVSPTTNAVPVNNASLLMLVGLALMALRKKSLLAKVIK